MYVMLQVVLCFFMTVNIKMQPLPCKAPTCHPTRRGCQCPNPWIEFLSKNARENGPASIGVHAAAYRNARDAGAFALNVNLPNNGRCRSDPYKLCAWLIRRLRARGDFHADVLEAARRRLRRILRTELRANPSPQGSDTEMMRSFLRDHLLPGRRASDIDRMSMAHMVEEVSVSSRLADRGVTLGRYLGSGTFGAAFSGTRNGAVCAIKVVVLRSAEERAEFNREVYVHDVAYQRLPNRVPRQLDVYTVAHGQMRLGIVIMQRVDGILMDILPRGSVNASSMRQIARQIKALMLRCARVRFLHGDLHVGNLGYKMVNGTPQLYMIDFGRSHVLRAGLNAEREVMDIDGFWMWRISLFQEVPAAFNRALHVTGFPGNPYIQQALGVDKPVRGVHTALQLSNVGNIIVARVLLLAEEYAQNANVPSIERLT